MFSISPGSSGSACSKVFEFEVTAVWASMPPPFPFQSGWIKNQHDLCHEQTTLHSRIVLRLRPGEGCPLSSLKNQSGQILTLANIGTQAGPMSRRQGNNSTVNRQRRLASLRFDQTEHRTVAALDEQHVLRSGDARRTLEIIAREFVEVWCSVQPNAPLSSLLAIRSS